MNTVPLIFILILAVCSSSQGASPCTATSPQSQYINFVQRHILQSVFNRNSVTAWEMKKSPAEPGSEVENICFDWLGYLRKKGLWCREKMQSFLETSQNDICTASGRRVMNGGNLCMSANNRWVYDVFTNLSRCQIKVTRRQTRVVVTCNKVNNRCLPVHFEPFTHKYPSIFPCVRTIV